MRKAIAIGFMFAVMGLPVCGQSTVKGLVVDKLGGRIPGADVIVSNKTTRQIKPTGDDGSFVFELPEGPYSVHVEKEAFHPSKIKKITIVRGKTADLAFVLVGVEVDRQHP